jgi:hypothetical protein
MDKRLSPWRLRHLFLSLLLLIGCGKKEETKMPANPTPPPVGGPGATTAGGPTSTNLLPPPPPEPP